MQEDASRPPNPASSPPPATRPARRAGSVWAAFRSDATGPQQTSPVSAPPRPERQRLSIHPLWLVLGVAALFGLVFGIGALTGGTSTTSTSVPSGTDIEATTIQVIHHVDPSVVQVQGRGSGAGQGSVGSGEILTTSGYIVTNDHVVHGLASFTVLLADGRQIAARLVGEAPSEDLAVLKVSASNLKPIAVGDSSQVRVGEYALALGSPLGLEQSATSGIVSALNRQANEVVDGATFTITGLIQTSAPINPGNSGGALVNLKGQLIGIPTLAAVEPSTGVAANGIGFAISSNRMRAIVRQLTGGAA
jgi:S1-C subfamily serine protease